MKQLIQTLRTGELEVVDVPPPSLRPGGVLVKTVASLISAGTEKSKVDLGKKSLLGKARSRPDDVKKVIREVQAQGLLNTYRKVMNKLETPQPLGYSSAGVVVAVAGDVDAFKPGDRVACAGGGYANHADLAFIPKNLVARIPDGVSFADAAYTTVAAIALQGIRQANPTLGETVLVIGLGLVGQLTVQMLKANGCQVIGLDVDPAAVELARTVSGCDLALNRTSGDIEGAIRSFTNGYGADAILITAAANTNDPVELSARVARDRARIVMVGVAGQDLPRGEFFQKELSFALSRSYGPGRYDPRYEEMGQDYPIGYVRWTEGRNLDAVLKLIAGGQLRVAELTTHRFPIERAVDAYELISARTERYVGVVIDYAEPDEQTLETHRTVTINRASAPKEPVEALGIGFLGAGNFAQAYLLPNVKSYPHTTLVGVATATGMSARGTAERFGFEFAATDPTEVLSRPDVGTVFVATRHGLHAELTVAAIRAGKNVFVEKPLATTVGGLRAVIAAHEANPEPAVMVGFNRRFAPLVVGIREAFASVREPLIVTYRVNAGFLPKEHWTQDPVEGGGRIIGEGCHFIDTISYLCGGSPVVKVYAEAVRSDNAQTTNADNVHLTLLLADGSIGHLLYLAAGDKGLPKERFELHGGGMSAILDDFKSATLWRGGKSKPVSGAEGKGHAQEVAAFLKGVSTSWPGRSPIPFASLVNTTLVTFAAIRSLETGLPVDPAELLRDPVEGA